MRSFLEQARNSISMSLQSPTPPAPLPPPVDTMHNTLKRINLATAVTTLTAGICLTAAISLTNDCANLRAVSMILASLLALSGMTAIIMRIKEPASVNTQSKIIIHPWSIKELVEVSLSSGTVTIGFADIILTYLHHIMLAAVSMMSLVALAMAIAFSDCSESNPYLFWGLTGASAATICLCATSKVLIIRHLPYGAMEYATIYYTNLLSALGAAWGYAKGAFTSKK
ncbi:putative transmembrane protein [Toxoplasma gondii VEG]|uniref:Transmembrane protein n=3 Tax=Toxoplasma gondii TaxID=5811 RepID=V4ZWM9_TOXGV|nr:putative transmembrane protein [Toxoplasma gondii VEG]KFG52505.1 putative transmembrane protein [Toxoplasma gondii p89]PUA87677.1 putative transmembrane protein [Toxoplasma gondii TgCATBr9]